METHSPLLVDPTSGLQRPHTPDDYRLCPAKVRAKSGKDAVVVALEQGITTPTFPEA